MNVLGYTVVRRLHLGGMTDIYIVLNERQERLLIRRMREEYAHQRRWRRAFERGAEILRTLEHPHIVRLLSHGVDQNVPYMVMEYVEAENLRTLLLARHELLTTHLLHLLRQLASALYYVHSMGYLHVDFKPENILISPAAHATLIDFDLAVRKRQRQTRVKEVDGTPFYLPPEALLRHRLDERADIYAFGVTAYEMVNYHKPFRGETLREAHAAQTTVGVEPAPLLLDTTKLPHALEALILKCLAKDPADRYPSMSLVLKALDNLV
jgi:eukaryotic-like serine/threonine-protein kinase